MMKQNELQGVTLKHKLLLLISFLMLVFCSFADNFKYNSYSSHTISNYNKRIVHNVILAKPFDTNKLKEMSKKPLMHPINDKLNASKIHTINNSYFIRDYDNYEKRVYKIKHSTTNNKIHNLKRVSVIHSDMKISTCIDIDNNNKFISKTKDTIDRKSITKKTERHTKIRLL